MADSSRSTNPAAEMSFLEHLEALRWHLVRSVVVVVTAAVVMFCYRDFVFDTLIFAPKHADFWTYRAMCWLSHRLGLGDALCLPEMPFQLINTTLSGQFTMHMWVALVAGIVVAFPYVVWELWRFIKPALSERELRYSRGAVAYITALFLMGVLFGYYIITPLSVNFLGGYQVSTEVHNFIEMESFISTVTTITFASGLLFELPVLVFFLSTFGIITPDFMRRFRKHSVVVILIIAAIITPSPDITSQLLVALPLYALYEASIFVSAYVVNKRSSTP